MCKAEASSFVFAQNKSQTGLEKHEGRMCIYDQMTLLIKERWDLYRYSVSSFCMGLYRRFSSCSRKTLSNHTSQFQLFGRRCSWWVSGDEDDDGWRNVWRCVRMIFVLHYQSIKFTNQSSVHLSCLLIMFPHISVWHFIEKSTFRYYWYTKIITLKETTEYHCFQFNFN